MKKLVLLALCMFGFTLSSQAQTIADNALGLRLGGSDGVGTEISYQRGLSENNRLELDLGWRNGRYYDAFKLTGIYQWVWNIEGGFNWYAGFGAGIGSVDGNEDHRDWNDDDGLFITAAGNVGIEYNFDFPLLLSLDFRPEFGVINAYGDDVDFDIALGIRYQF
ncbi:hypothetical protein [Salinimicrobium xinjiangense]|uniref:hypothetical protein n=1 Tax=Salinimicrobium xinjiangense TaxID=438596 RepID=UPI000426BAD3|nr:hypothetical protein [Salinimicrobium xinjiangense]